MLRLLQRGALVMLMLFSISCDAPRNNPLDPIIVHVPSVKSFQVYSSVLNDFGHPPRYQIFVKAKISDQYHSIDTVFVEVPGFKIRKKLNYNTNEDIYEYTLTPADFRTTRIEEIVGHDFHLTLRVKGMGIISHRPESIKRIIRDEVTIESPKGRDTVITNTPKLSWKKLNLEYSFSYMVEVYISDSSSAPAWRNTFPSTENSATVDLPLIQDEYYWVVWCVDNFNNRARSKPASFLIINKK